MNYAYATLMLKRSGEEINEQNLTAVLEASGTAVEASRVKAVVAALEDIDLDEAVSAEIDVGPADRAGNGFGEPPEESSVSGGADADAPTAADETSGAPSGEER